MRALRDVLGGALEKADVLRAARAHRVLRRWPEVVGAALAARSWPDRYERGTVWVAVEGSAWASELRMMKPRLLGRLNNLAGEPTLFQDLRFGDRAPREGLEAREEVPPEEPPIERPDLAGLTIAEIAAKRMKQWEDEDRT